MGSTLLLLQGKKTNKKNEGNDPRFIDTNGSASLDRDLPLTYSYW
jgi:hypothetical protein